MKTDPHPLDVEALSQGDYIPPTRVAEIIGVPIDQAESQPFRCGLLQLVTELERRLLEIGRNWTLVTRHSGIRVLTDKEAHPHNNSGVGNKLRGAKYRLFKLTGVDRAKLDSEGQRKFDYDLMTRTLQIQALEAAEKRKLPFMTDKPRLSDKT